MKGKKAKPQFSLVYYLGSQRVKKNFGDFQDAKKEGHIVALKLSNNEHQVLKLTSDDRTSYVEAMALLKPLNMPLHVAIKQYASAIKRLPAGTTLHEVVDFFLRRNPAKIPQLTVRQVVNEMVEAKRKAGRGDVHLKDLTGRLGKFADAFQIPEFRATRLSA